MRILHYFLGFPPYRTGGLTKYAYDLMITQVQYKNNVFALYPGRLDILCKNVKIKRRKDNNQIINYEIINPLPVPLLDGIQDIEEYTKKCDKEVFINFLNSIRPDVIHIHTLMGLHKEFIESAKILKIKTIFTSHDYFGICPKVNLLKADDKICESDGNCEDCVKCNVNALSMNKIRLLQSPLYRLLKNSRIVKMLRNNHIETKDNSINNLEQKKSLTSSEDYIKLRNFYINMLESIDIIHFNSNLAREIYLKYIKPKKEIVIPIIHRDIRDCKQIKEFQNKLRITYLGPTKRYKGFHLLLDVLDELFYDNNLELNIYYNTSEKREYLKINDSYNYDELTEIFKKTDILVAPSLWYETFGFTVLEALSYGVPVLITKNVGAKDIVKEYGYVVEPTKEQLKNKIKYILENREDLKNKNKMIVEKFELPQPILDYNFIMRM